MEFTGKVVSTFVRGVCVAGEGAEAAAAGHGRMLRRGDGQEGK